MKNSFLIKAAIVLPFGVVYPGMAVSQSVLERVLGQIDSAVNISKVNGTFANIAENVGGVTIVEAGAGVITGEIPGYDVTSFSTSENVESGLNELEASDVIFYVDHATDLFAPVTITADDLDTAVDLDGKSTIQINSDGTVIVSNTDGASDDLWNLYDASRSTAILADLDETTNAALIEFDTYRIYSDGTDRYFSDPAVASSENYAGSGFEAIVTQVTSNYLAFSPYIDGSITNLLSGVQNVTASAISSSSSAVELAVPTLDLGDMATTALGAVNTGEITLGVNSSVDDAKASSAAAVSAALEQIGGSADTGAIVVNIASNMMAVDGSIRNTMYRVNGSVGNLSTTALGAVNTGAIVSGVDAAVQGIVGTGGQ